MEKGSKESEKRSDVTPASSILTPSPRISTPVVTVEMQGSDDEGDEITIKAKSGHQSRLVVLEAAKKFCKGFAGSAKNVKTIKVNVISWFVVESHNFKP